MNRRLVAVGIAVLVTAAACSGDDGGSAEEAESITTTTEAARTGTFTSLTYNVAGLPQGINPDQFPEQHQPLISPRLNDYDVVVVQEDFGFYTDVLRADADHEFRTEPHPGPGQLNPINRADAAVGDGLNVLSRLPLGDVERVPWSLCAPASADCLALKGFLATTLEVDEGVTVDLYTLHLEAGGQPDDEQARAQDLTELAAHLAEQAKGDAVILGGDWNLRYEDEPDRTQLETFLEETDLQDVCDVVDCGADDDVIDRFFFRSGDDVAIEPIAHRFERDVFVNQSGDPLSDHDPLAVTWRWTAG